MSKGWIFLRFLKKISNFNFYWILFSWQIFEFFKFLTQFRNSPSLDIYLLHFITLISCSIFGACMYADRIYNEVISRLIVEGEKQNFSLVPKIIGINFKNYFQCQKKWNFSTSYYHKFCILNVTWFKLNFYVV